MSEDEKRVMDEAAKVTRKALAAGMPREDAVQLGADSIRAGLAVLIRSQEATR